jgi:hypothetical protein
MVSVLLVLQVLMVLNGYWDCRIYWFVLYARHTRYLVGYRGFGLYARPIGYRGLAGYARHTGCTGYIRALLVTEVLAVARHTGCTGYTKADWLQRFRVLGVIGYTGSRYRVQRQELNG